MKEFFKQAIPNSNVDLTFDPMIECEAKNINNGLFTDSSKFRYEFEGFSIDKPGSRELDDGLLVNKTSYGYEVFVCVSDVSEFVKYGTLLDKEAFLRGKKVHGSNIFPLNISKNISSLNEGEETLSLTLNIELDHDFNTLDFRVYESRFFNIKAFDYKTFEQELKNTSSQYSRELNSMLDLAEGLKTHKFVFNGIRTSDYLDLNGNLNNKLNDIGSFVISQIITLANIELARFMIKNKIETIFRNYIPNFCLNTTNVYKKPYYSTDMIYHSGLNISPYTHFTSPIRRYTDIIIARQLKSFLRNEEFLYDKGDLINICSYINSRVYNILGFDK